MNKNDLSLLTITEASKLLGVCKETLRRWDSAGHLKACRLPTGRRLYKREDVQAMKKQIIGGK